MPMSVSGRVEPCWPLRSREPSPAWCDGTTCCEGAGMTTAGRTELLAELPFLGKVSDELRTLLLQSSRSATFGFGDVILEHGAPIDDLVLVRTGRVRVLGV